MSGQPVLNWQPHWDERNENYLVRNRLAAPGPLRSYSWKHITLDQGQEGECVAFGLTEEAAARPVAVFGDPVRKPPDVRALNELARAFFRDVRAIDRAEGRYFDAGATSLAGAKAGQRWGWWKSYLWATTAEEIAFVVGRRGPVALGTWVYASMFTAGRGDDDRTYTVPPGARRLGGHLYAITKVDAKGGRLWTPNSWGGYGAGWLPFELVDRLLREDGEGLLPQGRGMGRAVVQ